jgi:hypothetical protein
VPLPPSRFAVETVESRSAFPPFPPLSALPPSAKDGWTKTAMPFFVFPHKCSSLTRKHKRYYLSASLLPHLTLAARPELRVRYSPFGCDRWAGIGCAGLNRYAVREVNLRPEMQTPLREPTLCGVEPPHAVNAHHTTLRRRCPAAGVVIRPVPLRAPSTTVLILYPARHCRGSVLFFCGGQHQDQRRTR